jgi:methylthioribulose-1-phosphate dehydratase
VSPHGGNDRGAVTAIKDLGRWLDSRGWAPATSGNFSTRLDGARIAITVSGRQKGELADDDVMLIDREGRALDQRRPSAEAVLHAAIYRLMPEVAAVIHTHSVPGTVLGMRLAGKSVIEFQGYEMAKAFRGMVSHTARISLPVLENAQDMASLAAQLESRLEPQGTVGVLVRGHGLYTWGRTMDEARRCIEALEFIVACELQLLGPS